MGPSLSSSRACGDAALGSEASPCARSAEVGVLVLALAMRIAWAVVVTPVPISDCAAYDILARGLIEGRGYAFAPGEPSAYWPVGTSAVFALLYKIFGVGYRPIIVMNVLVGAATVWLTMRLTRDWFGEKAGLAAGLFMAVWPGQVEFTTLLASELLFNICVLLALYAESRDRWSPKGRAVAVGVWLAGASYVRPIALLLPLVFAWCRLMGPQRESRRVAAVLAETAAVAVVMAVLIAPWSIRNTRVFGRSYLISNNGGPNLWMGNNPGAYGGPMALPARVKGMNEADRDELLGGEAKRYIRENPGVFLVGLVKKLIVTHDRESIGVVWNEEGLTKAFGARVLMPLKGLSAAYWWGMLLLAVCGTAAAAGRMGFREWAGLTPLVLWAYFAAIHAVIVGSDRYHYPSVPMIGALAGLGAVALLDRARTKVEPAARAKAEAALLVDS
jgi:4-amino-4-deoxy-L-arabinose transferase-like glycosyltransferase